MTLRNVLGVLLLVVGLNACVTTTTPVSFNPEGFSSLLERRQFTLARSMLYGSAGMQLGEAQRQQYAEQLDMAAGLYVEDLLARAQQQERQQQWYAAGELYREGLDALPQSTELQLAHDAFAQQRSHYVEDIQHDLKLHRAVLLPREIELTRLLSEVYPRDQRQQNKLYDMQQEAGSLVLFLGPLAQQAFADGQFKQAKSYDQQILALGDSEQSRVRIAAVEQKLNQDAQRRTRTRQQANKKKREDLWKNYNTALEQADYLQARAVLAELDALGFKGPIARDERVRLDALIDEKCSTLIAEGKQFYTRGKLDAAIDSWRQALVLIPDDQELASRIKRAETFQANYQRLSR